MWNYKQGEGVLLKNFHQICAKIQETATLYWEICCTFLLLLGNMLLLNFRKNEYRIT